MVLAVDYLLAGLHDGIVLLLGEKSKLVVGHGGRHLCYSQALDEERILVEMEFADLEVFDSAQCLYAVEGACRNLAGAKKVALSAKLVVHINAFYLI